MTIMAIDPGGTTGLAFFDQSPKVNYPYINVSETKELHVIVKCLHFAEKVVYEGFSHRNIHTADYTAVERIGVIKYLCNDVLEIPCIEQQPTQKQFWTRQKITKLGAWQPNMPHAMDALRHLLYYMLFTEKEEGLLYALEGT